MSVLVSLLAAPPATDESFEVGTGWNVFETDPNHLAMRASQAAHQGGFGFRLVDRVVNEGVFGPVLNWSVPMTVAKGPVYLRLWARFSGVSGPVGGGVQFANLHRVEPGSAVVALSYLGSPGRFSSEGNGLDDSGMTANEGFGAELADDGGWHLYEYRAAALAGDRLEYAVARDGVVVADRLAPYFSRGVFQYLEVGFIYTYAGRFAGTMDLDDLRAGSTPLASRLSLGAPSSASPGECVPLTVRLVDSWDGGMAEAVADIALSVTAIGAEVFPNQSCLASTMVPRVAAQATSTVFTVRPSDAGSLLVRVESIDLIGDEVVLRVEASASVDGGVADAGSVDGGVIDAGQLDGGADAGVGAPGNFRVECGCSESSGAAWLLVLIVLVARRLTGTRMA